MAGAMAASASAAAASGGMSAGDATLGDMSALGGTGGTTGASTMGATKKGGQHAGFRSHNVRFLQEQNNTMTKALDALEQERDGALETVQKWEQKRAKIQQEYRSLQHELVNTEEQTNVSAVEVQKRDEQIRLLAEQNRSLLDMLEQEERTSKEREQTVNQLTGKHDKLQAISDQYDNIKETGNQALASAYTEIAKYEEELRNAQNETEQLREADANFAAQAKVDIEQLERKLKDAKDKNVEHLKQIQHNEVHEHRMGEAIQKLKETLDELSAQKKGIRMQLDMDVENRDRWTQSKTEVEHRKQMLERTVDALRQSLRSAEDQNQRMQEENKQGADNFRQLGDKVYELMETLRQNQLGLKKAEMTGAERQKNIVNLDKNNQALQQNLQIEVDAKLAAEAEARNAAQMQALLLKKNKMLEEAHILAVRAQEKVEKRLQELTDKSFALQTQNDYLATRIDGNEEDKGALKYELRRMEEEMRQASATNAQLTQQKTEADDRYNDLYAEKGSVQAELDYIKREDMLDESGRTKPILIESDSKLIERLQVNEFLYSAQQARNPVPMLVEKISHILELLHTSQTQADLYLQDLQRSNSMLTALRHKNMALYERVQMCETWKMRALLKIASNAFEMRQNVKGHVVNRQNGNLYLDGLQYTAKELIELKKVITNYGKMDMVKEIRLQDNALDHTCVQPLCELMDLCPYLSRLDLRRNKLDDAAQDQLRGFVERIPGITSLLRDPATGDLTAKSGPQVRLVVNLQDQNPPDPNATPGSPTAGDLFAEDASGVAADAFLSSSSGVVAQTRLQGADAMAGTGLARTQLPPQRSSMGATGGLGRTGGLGESTSLPRIPSASPGPGSGRQGNQPRGR